jgi:hypothetical protein
MSLTRKFLSAMGIEGDKIDEIITAHVDTVDALKEERDKYKADAEANKASADKLPSIEKELKELKEAQGNNIYETKYNEMKAEKDKLKEEFDKYKADIDAAEVKRSKESAYRALLKAANVSEKRIDKILKVTDIDALELDKDGKFKDEESLSKSIKDEWGDFIVKEHQSGANPATPPTGDAKVPKGESRAAKIAAQYHANLYGDVKEAN